MFGQYKPKPDIEPETFFGKVKQVKETYLCLKWFKDKTSKMVQERYAVKTYDKNGNITGLKYFNNGDTLMTTETYAYDAENHLLEWNKYEILHVKPLPGCAHGYMSRPFKKVFKYDLQGNLIEALKYIGDRDEKNKPAFITKYEYKENGLVIEKIYNSNDKLGWMNSMRYDSLKKQIEVIKFDVKDTLNLKPVRTNYRNINKANRTGSSYTYEYDKKGNWVRKSTFYRDKNTNISLREIKYY
jgi:hypothetical protein